MNPLRKSASTVAWYSSSPPKAGSSCHGAGPRSVRSDSGVGTLMRSKAMRGWARPPAPSSHVGPSHRVVIQRTGGMEYASVRLKTSRQERLYVLKSWAEAFLHPKASRHITCGTSPQVDESSAGERPCPVLVVPEASISLVQVAGDPVAGTHLLEHWYLLGALGHHEGAAGVEAAAFGRVQRAGNLARQHDLLPVFIGMGRQGGGEEGLVYRGASGSRTAPSSRRSPRSCPSTSRRCDG